MGTKSGQIAVVSVTHIVDILDTFYLKETLDFLDTLVNRAAGFEPEFALRLLAAHSIVSGILEGHFGTFDFEVRKMVTDLIREIDDPHVLTMKIENAGMV